MKNINDKHYVEYQSVQELEDSLKKRGIPELDWTHKYFSIAKFKYFQNEADINRISLKDDNIE